ncbi:MAG: chemotaxis-specific protein-glutamate methyltransferase CheB [Pseudomonadota bacterium]
MSAPANPRPEKPEAEGSDDAVRVMVVDDSLTVRTIFKRMVESDPRMTVAATASSAERAIAQLATTPVDVVLLDLEMPGMGGLEALPEILLTAQNAQVLVVSSLTEDGAEHTVSALSMGAADTMLKPRPGGFNDEYRAQLLDKIRALGTSASGAGASEGGAEAATIERAGAAPVSAPAIGSGKRPELIAIGASTGGIHALNIMLRVLSPDFNLPILITQHLPPSFIPVFARQIELACSRRAVIAEEGTEIRAGEVAIATGHGHMMVRRVADRLIARTCSEPVHSGCLPSVDPMFESCAAATDGRMLAVVLSGMGRDGLKGARAVADAGGAIIAQDADTSAVWGMPGAVTKAGLTSLVASPEALGVAIMAHAGSRSAQAFAR